MNTDELRERILSLWGAICTASQGKPDSFFVHYWSQRLRDYGDCYVAIRQGKWVCKPNSMTLDRRSLDDLAEHHENVAYGAAYGR